MTAGQAQAELDQLMRVLAERHPESNRGRGVRLETLRDATVGDSRQGLLLVLGAAALVLLLACANLTALLVGRMAARERDLVVLSALGASRGRIARQLLLESLLLALLGGVGGVLLASWGTRALVALAGPTLPRADAVGVDGTVLAFAALVSLLCGIGLGLLPAANGARLDLSGTLRGRAAPRRQRLRPALVSGQVALALVLVMAAGLVGRSLFNLAGVDPGLRARDVLTFDLTLPEARYRPGAAVRTFFERLESRLAALPGARSVGAVSILPFSGSYSCDGFELVAGTPLPDDACAEFRITTGDYFATLGIPVLAGRALDRRDAAESPRAAVVNRAFVRRYLAPREPLGRRLIYGEEFEIVGVVGNVRHFGLDRAPEPEVYLPLAQYPFLDNLTVVVETAGVPGALADEVRAAVHRLDPELPVADLRPMDRVIAARSLVRPRFRAVLFGGFALLALLLAAVGIYGTVAAFTAARSREIGIRMALGEDAARVVRRLVGFGLGITTAGLLAGTAATYASMRLLQSMLFGIGPMDAATFSATAGSLGAVAVLAAWLPARRATRLDPMEVLREG